MIRQGRSLSSIYPLPENDFPVKTAAVAIELLLQKLCDDRLARSDMFEMLVSCIPAGPLSRTFGEAAQIHLGICAWRGPLSQLEKSVNRWPLKKHCFFYDWLGVR